MHPVLAGRLPPPRRPPPPAARCIDRLVRSGGEHGRPGTRLHQRIERSGEAWLATTVIGGRRVLRINTDSLLSAQHHGDELVELLVREGEALSTPAS